jgi:hypothetical protein
MLDDDLQKLREIPDPLAGLVALPAEVRPPERRPTRKDHARARRVGLAVGSAWLAAQLLVAGIRPDVEHVPLSYWIEFGVAPLAAGALCFVAALSSGRIGAGQRVTLLATLSLLAPLLYTLSGYLLAPPYAGAPIGDLKHGVSCLNVALAWTLLPLLAAGVALRRSFIGRPVLRSALLGAGAGLIVSVISTLRCPLSGALHVALSHGGAVIVTALLGAVLLSRVTRA